MDALAFLSKPPAAIQPLYVLYGDEAFFKRQIQNRLKAKILGDDPDDAALTVLSGDKATFADVFDELETASFFTPHRLLIVENGELFVTKYRPQLEKKVSNLPTTGTLILDVKTWPANTRLAKMVSEERSVNCKSLPAFKLGAWCVDWSKAVHDKPIALPAANLLVDLVGPDMGLLDQELLKLAIYVGDRAKIDVADVDKLVGHSREENIWKFFDFLSEGKPADAFALLHQVFEQGDDVHKILGGFGFQLRKLAAACRLIEQGQSMGGAVAAAGFAPFAARGAEAQLRHLGRRRAGQLYEGLLKMYMDLRGNAGVEGRLVLERFLVGLARKSG